MKTVKSQFSDRVTENNVLDSTPENKPKTLVTNKSLSFWAVFTSTFVTIFLAEIGDKTQVVTLLMSAESQSPWLVFFGAAAALITTSLLGVLIGYWLSKKLDPKVLDLSVAILLLFITAWLISDIL
ncbi:putative membrane protein [Xenococcus sp. PCC 7305]|uniref:TMEM165/GDT1 family protein n=1 Tax=Xenococcus sp. PCC 7305 TaxID=102125 RepID=UPI0002AC716A|nr:TMEM165/GDT1 family protein [Xenococcus sp. PCC 7305]ELS02136.1 putative membrane protein [Xenococcus sp. PCC 7305]